MAGITVPGGLRLERTTQRAWHAFSDRLQWLGALLIFAVQILLTVPHTLRRYGKEVLRLLAELAFGSRLLAVMASTIVVVVILSTAVGIEVGVEGVQGLQVIGLAPLGGFLSAFGNTREIAPLITGFGIAAQLGCRFTSQLGAMRISEEIDALEVMAVPPLPFLVTTRAIASMVAILPLYLISLAGAYICTELAITKLGNVGSGTYSYYFHSILTGRDVAYSVAKVAVFAVIVTVVHCYYGYHANGGPEGVGRATGRAIRTSIVSIAIVDMLLTLLFWGSNTGIHLTG